MKTPRLLYKYKAFNNYLLQELCGAEALFASPSLFNDPLDSKPSIHDNLVLSDKEELLRALYREHKPKTDVGRILGNFKYLATEDASGEEVDKQYERFVSVDIHRMLLHEFGKRGILSLAERWNCPLMWSHYADQHKGLCLEYSTHESVANNLSQVRYNADRAIPLSEVFAWKVGQAPGARKTVLDLAFLSKAPAWKYEREWRILAERPGSLSVPLRLTGIYFGERCSPAIQTVIVKALYDAHPKATFYRIHFDPKTFQLRKRKVDVDEEIQCGIRPPVALSFRAELAPVLPPGAIPLLSTSNDPDEGEPYFQR